MNKTVRPMDAQPALAWETFIPLFTNPFLWLDFAKALAAPAVLFSGLIAVILAGDNDPDWASAFSVLAVCLAGVAVLFGFVELVVLRNRLAVRYTLDDEGVAYESGRPVQTAQKIGLLLGALARSPLLAGGSLLASTTNALTVRWRDVKKVTAFPGRKVITLSNSWRPVLRIYCPDAGAFESARRHIAAIVPAGRGQSK